MDVGELSACKMIKESKEKGVCGYVVQPIAGWPIMVSLLFEANRHSNIVMIN
jgi:hypothetical protein